MTVGIALDLFDVAMAVRGFVVQRERSIVATPDPVPHSDDRSPRQPIDAADRHRWAEYAWRLFSVPASGVAAAPSVDLIRVGPSVELLCSTPRAETPPGFLADVTGTVFEIEPGIELEDIEHLLIEGAGEVVQLGDDADASYFAQRPDRSNEPAPDVPMAAASGVAIVKDGEWIVVEPYGLRLRSISSDGETSPYLSATGGVLGDVDADSASLPQPGSVEIRILREIPDLVGDVGGCSAAGVELIAYLATHGGRATSMRLRDALGTSRSRGSQSPKTVWAAATAARKALGEERFPVAVGNQLYLLGPDVTCDWVRLLECVEIARSTEDSSLRRNALVTALDLVGGVPATASNRFGWLDRDGTLSEVTRVVIAAAEQLATAAADADEPDVAGWAARKRRIFLPDGVDDLAPEFA